MPKPVAPVFAATIGCVLSTAAILGCGPVAVPSRPEQASPTATTPGHNDHDHGDEAHAASAGKGAPQLPGDFVGRIAELQRQHTIIRDAFQAQDLEKAHEPLHRVGLLLEGLAELADAAGFDAQDLAVANSATAALFEAYGEIDEAIHAGKSPEYSAVSAEVDRAMSELEAVTGRLKKPE